MPNFDGTGPRGEGAKTGRGMGKCNTGDKPQENAKTGKGLGLGKGAGTGRGRGRGLGLGKGNVQNQ